MEILFFLFWLNKNLSPNSSYVYYKLMVSKLFLLFFVFVLLMLMFSVIHGNNNYSDCELFCTSREWDWIEHETNNNYWSKIELTFTYSIISISPSGLLNELSAMYKMPVQGGDDLGDVSVEWDVRGKSSHISQFNVKWVCEADGHSQKKVINAHSHHANFPVMRRK